MNVTRTRTYRKSAIVLAAAVAAAIFTLYELHGGSAASAPPPAPTQSAVPATAAVPANPVPILEKMHVPIPSGESVGQVDIYGDRYASGMFADGEQVIVYTYATAQDEVSGVKLASAYLPSDSNKLLVGRLFTVGVTGVQIGSDNAFQYPESPATLAKESGAVDTGQ